MFEKIKALPVWLKKGITDFVETGIAAVLAVTFTLPAGVEDAKNIALIFGAAILGAAIAAVRRAFPSFMLWWKEKTGTEDEG